MLERRPIWILGFALAALLVSAGLALRSLYREMASGRARYAEQARGMARAVAARLGSERPATNTIACDPQGNRLGAPPSFDFSLSAADRLARLEAQQELDALKRAGEREQLLARLVELSEFADTPNLAAWACSWLAVERLGDGDLVGARAQEEVPDPLQIGPASAHLAGLFVVRAGVREELSLREVQMLRLLWRERGKAVTRERFLDEVWGREHFPTTRTVDQHIVKLRQKIEQDPAKPRYLLTAFGVGYRLELS